MNFRQHRVRASEKRHAHAARHLPDPTHAFRKIVWDHYRKHGRHDLPWRQTRDPYQILVSEVMLQQTQVDRVAPFYERFVRKFPTARVLSRAPLSRVLVAWQGLGYNRRAKHLHAATKKLINDFDGVFPQDAEAIESLPGVGSYTARAVAAFAFNRDGVFIETNIRTAIMHHFFPHEKIVSDADIGKMLARALPKGKAREWNAALMDYGAYLKRSGVRANVRVKGYAKQTKFAGSVRQARGAALRALAEGPLSLRAVIRLLGEEREAQMKDALASLKRDGLVQFRNGTYKLPR